MTDYKCPKCGRTVRRRRVVSFYYSCDACNIMWRESYMASYWDRDAEEAEKTCLNCSNKPTCDIDGEAKLTVDYEYAARDEDFFCKFWEKK